MPAKQSKQSKAKRPPVVLAIFAAVTGGVIWFAVQGGEYGTADLWRQSTRLSSLQQQVDSLQHQVDSLSRWKRAIETDPLVQERLAREEFGMVKGDKEMLYRFAEDRR